MRWCLFAVVGGAMMSVAMKHVLKKQQGFALPTILVASVIMLIVLLSAITAVTAITGGLNSQYYNQLAREAAESGLAYAEKCLRGSGYNPTWSNAAPLKPDVDCTGTPLGGGASPWVVNTGSIRTSFTVGLPDVGGAGSLRIVANSKVELLRTSSPSDAWRSYSATVAKVSRYNDLPQIGGGAGWKDNGHIGSFLGRNGHLYAWGDNSTQEIGDTSLGVTVSTPVEVTMPTGVTRAKRIYSTGEGASILCILGSDDQIYCRGKPGNAENGLMPAAPGWYRFGLAVGLTALDFAVNGLSADNACALASDKQVYCAGENRNGVLGAGDNSASVVPIGSPTKFNLTAAGPSLQAAKVFIQDNETCVIATDGAAYCAGANAAGQLGRGNTTSNPQGISATPAKVQMPGGLTVSDVRTTYHGPSNAQFYQTSVEGRMFMSGSNSYGTAVDGSFAGTIYSIPREITIGSFSRLISIGKDGAADESSICVIGRDAVKPDSGIWCAGGNAHGQLGNGNCGTHQANWQGTLNLGGETISKSLSTSFSYQMNSVLVITTDGNAWAWGDNTYGKLGIGAAYQTCVSTPTKVQLPAGVKAVSAANGDEYSAFILGDNGKVYAMGRNNNGQLGDGTTIDRNVPVEVKLPRQETIY